MTEQTPGTLTPYCATIGCTGEPTDVLVWRERDVVTGDRTHEPVCLDCAWTYSRCAGYGRHYYLEDGKK